MRKPLALFAAASFTVGGLAFMGPVALGDEGNMKASVSVQTELPEGITRSEQADNSGIHRALSSTTDAIVNENFDGLLSGFAAGDRTRLNDLSTQQHEQLKTTISQFKEAWKAKYDQDFSLEQNQQMVFGDQFQDFTIVQGEISNPALLSNWPVESKKTETEIKTGADQPGRMDSGDRPEAKADIGGPGNPPVEVVPDADDAAVAAGGDVQVQTGQQAAVAGTQLQSGQEVAIVTFPRRQNAEAVTVSLIRDSTDAADATAANWRIDLPDSMTSRQLLDNLNKHLGAVNGMQAQWPADSTEAYRLVAHHLLMALYDTGSM